MKKEKVIQKLREAKALIATYGWITDTYGSCAEGFCSFGALWKASGEPASNAGVMGQNHLNRAAKILVDTPDYDKCVFSVVTYYNDVQAQNVEDIYKLFDKAIELAEAE